jgi:hypothetical protein
MNENGATNMNLQLIQAAKLEIRPKDFQPGLVMGKSAFLFVGK